MVKMNFYLTERQVQALKVMSDKIGLSMSELLRRAIDAFIGAQDE